MYQQAVTRLIAAADRVAEYRSDLAAFADTLGGKDWGEAVTGPVRDMHGQLSALEGEYRDLAGQIETQGDAGVTAHEQAPWVPGDLLDEEFSTSGTAGSPVLPEVPVSVVKPPGLPRGELRVVKTLAPGKRAAVDLVEDADGRVAIRKVFHSDAESDADDMADREVAAAAVARAVGITDLEVRRVGPDTVLMTYVEGRTGTELAHSAMSPEDVALLDDEAATCEQLEDPEWLARWSKADDEYRENLQPWLRAPGAKEIGLFDYLALNIDRNSSNWIVGNDGRVHPIDHDATFIGSLQQQDGLIDFDSPFMRAWLAKDSDTSGHARPAALASPFARSDLEQVMERLADAQPALDKIPPVRGVSTYDLVRQRLAWLIDACDATT